MPPDERTHRLGVLSALGMSAILALLLATVARYNFGANVHHDQVLPFILNRLQPGLFAGDAYVATGAWYPSLFPALAARLCRTADDLPTIFFWLNLVRLAGLGAGITALAFALFPDARSRWLSVLLIVNSRFLEQRSFLGNDVLFRGYADATGLAWMFLLAALALWLSGRRPLAFLWVGVSALFTPLSSLHIGLTLLLAGLWSKNEKSGDSAIKTTALSVLFWTAGALPLLRVLVQRPSYGPVSNAFVLQTLRLWYPFHYFPELWSPGRILLILSTLSLYAVLWRNESEALGLRLSAIFRAALILIAIGLLAPITGLSTAVRLQGLRVDVVLILFSLFLASSQAVRLARSSAVGDFLLAILLVLTVTWNPGWPAALLCAVLLVARPWLAGPGSPRLPRPIQRLSLAALTAVALTPSAVSLWSRWHGQLLPFEEMSRYSTPEVTALEEWCRFNTPEASLFLVPPYMRGFRTVARRPCYFLSVDAAAVHWKPDFSVLWLRRMNDIKGDPAKQRLHWREVEQLRHTSLWIDERSIPPPLPLTLAYSSLDAKDLIRLRDHDAVRYAIVFRKEGRLPFLLLHVTKSFQVYDLTQSGSETDLES